MEGFPHTSSDDSVQPERQRIGLTGGKISRNKDLGIEPVGPTATHDYSTDPYNHPFLRQYTPEQIADGDISLDDHS